LPGNADRLCPERRIRESVFLLYFDTLQVILSSCASRCEVNLEQLSEHGFSAVNEQ
jgi:hypothetical protein